MPLAGRSLSFRVMEALRLVNADAYVLATDAESAPFLEADAAEAGFVVVVGPRDDVLARYAMAARRADADSIVRATGDNPLVSFELANRLIERSGCADVPPDYAAFDAAPLGSGVELVRTEALFAAEAEASDPYEREHVCPFLYRRPERFRIERPRAPAPYDRPDIRVTVDTKDDYDRVNALFDAIHRGRPVGIDETIAYFGAPERA